MGMGTNIVAFDCNPAIRGLEDIGVYDCTWLVCPDPRPRLWISIRTTVCPGMLGRCEELGQGYQYGREFESRGGQTQGVQTDIRMLTVAMTCAGYSKKKRQGLR